MKLTSNDLYFIAGGLSGIIFVDFGLLISLVFNLVVLLILARYIGE